MRQPNDTFVSVPYACVLVRAAMIALWSLWLGGFTFYAGIVVPVGTEVLGSPLEQGLVTQQVTRWLNLLGVSVAVGFVLLVPLARLGTRQRQRWIPMLLATSFLSCGAFLIYWHQRMSALINLNRRWIEETDQFYGDHQVYLWVSIAQWLIGWGLLAWLVIAIHPRSPLDTLSSASSATDQTG